MAAGIAAEAGLVAKKALAVWLSVETPLVLSGQSGEAKLDNSTNGVARKKSGKQGDAVKLVFMSAS